MNAKGRVKEDGVFKFYEQESCQRGMSYHARRTTHDPRPTTHYPPTHANQSISSPKYYIKLYKQQKRTLKGCQASKFSKTKISIPFNRLQVCPSLVPFVLTVFIIPSFNVLSDIQLLISQVVFRDSCPLNGSCLRHMFLQPPGEGILQNVLALQSQFRRALKVLLSPRELTYKGMM